MSIELSDVAILERAREVMQGIKPYVQSHGGTVEVLSVRDGVVDVEFRAACRFCEMKAVTFGGTVRPVLLELEGVVGVTCRAVELSPERLDRIAEFFGQP